MLNTQDLATPNLVQDIGILRQQLARLQRERDDLEVMLDTTTMHAEEVENELHQQAEELQRLHQQEQKYLAAVRRELKTGQQIQADFLPEALPQVEGWDLAAYFNPAQEVSGDFYDVFQLEYDRLAIVIADVCDKGVGAALFMALTRSVVRVLAQQAYSRLQQIGASAESYYVEVPGIEGEAPLLLPVYTYEILRAIGLANDYITDNHSRTEMFATIFFAVIDLKRGQVAYINGGHDAPFYLSAAGFKERLRLTGPAVGIIPGSTYRVGAFKMAPGETLLAYTDGVTEAANSADELFSEARLHELLDKLSQQTDVTAESLLAKINEQVHEHIAERPARDDITMLAVRYLPETRG